MSLSPPPGSEPRRRSFLPLGNMVRFAAAAAAAAAEEHLILPPGFRFHPTDEELITHYLSPKMVDGELSTQVIGEVDLNKVEPWDLPWKGKMGEKEWYFFCRKDRKYPTGLRTNRATGAGYWKATGKDKEIFRSKSKILIGMKKTLVFYQGRAPRGQKTDWVMHEFRSNPMQNHHKVTQKNEWVISRVFKKSSGGKKVHISDLSKTPDSGGASRSTTDLPPLMDMAEASRATYFSNSIEEMAGELTPSSHKSERNSHTYYYDSVMPQDQSLLSLLLENQESFPVFSGETNTSASTCTGFRPIYDHEQLITADSGGFGPSWNYPFLLE